jgi:hypothetical protein
MLKGGVKTPFLPAFFWISPLTPLLLMLEQGAESLALCNQQTTSLQAIPETVRRLKSCVSVMLSIEA